MQAVVSVFPRFCKLKLSTNFKHEGTRISALHYLLLFRVSFFCNEMKKEFTVEYSTVVYLANSAPYYKILTTKESNLKFPSQKGPIQPNNE